MQKARLSYWSSVLKEVHKQVKKLEGNRGKHVAIETYQISEAENRGKNEQVSDLERRGKSGTRLAIERFLQTVEGC